MASEQEQSGSGDLNREAQRIWNGNAEFWDTQFGEGNDFQRYLIGPSTERLLEVRPGQVVLDVACGNGAFSRRLAELGATVVATDFSEKFLNRARARTQSHAERIEYRFLDATDEQQLLALGDSRFDSVVCTMALMDMAEIEPFFGALPRLLKPGGCFVFSVTHPCFNTTGTTKMLEEEDTPQGVIATYSVKVARYLGLSPGKGTGMIGQPEAQLYFDRPISVLLGALFQVGLVVDGMEEPAFGPEVQGSRPLSWQNLKEIPPVLVCRARVPSTR